MLIEHVRATSLPPVETKAADSAAKPDAPLSGARPRRYRARRTTSDRVRDALLAMGRGHARLLTHQETPWNSITFAGTRHEVTLAFEGAGASEAGEAFIAHLPEHEFALPGQLVADATIREVDHRFGADERLVVTAVLLLLEEV